MKLSTQIKAISYLRSHSTEIVISNEEYAETLAMLKLLALGNYEIESKQFRNAKQVVADLNKV